MRLSFPLALALALIANLVPSFGKGSTAPAGSNTPPPQTPK
jgi:hypothetical protein